MSRAIVGNIRTTAREQVVRVSAAIVPPCQTDATVNHAGTFIKRDYRRKVRWNEQPSRVDAETYLK